MGLPILYFKEYKFLNYDVFLSMKVDLISANSADPDEMQYNAAFHLGLYCLPEYLVSGFQYTMGYDRFSRFATR